MITNGWYSYCLAVVEWFHQAPKLWLFCRPLHLQQANSGMGKSLGLRPGTGSQFPPRKLHAHVHGCHCLERLCWSVCAIKTNAVMLLTKNMVTNFKTYRAALAGEWDTKFVKNTWLRILFSVSGNVVKQGPPCLIMQYIIHRPLQVIGKHENLKIPFQYPWYWPTLCTAFQAQM